MRNFFKKYKNALPVVVLCTILFTALILLQSRYDSNVELKNFYDPRITKHVLPASIVKNLSFGFKNFLADVYWINIIQDLASWDRTDDFYIEEYRNLATLDPQFAYPYLFGILTVTSKKYPDGLDKIEPIINIGIQHIPYNWEIPFYLGTAFNLIKKYDSALHYIGIAVSRPAAPNGVHEVYNRYVKRILSGDNASQAFIKTIYDTTESATTKKIIEQGMVIDDLTRGLQSIVDIYKNKYGKYPTSVDDMVARKIIKVSPELQNQFNITIDKNTGIVEIIPKNK